MLRHSRVGWAFVAFVLGTSAISAQGQLFLEDHETFAVGVLNGQGGWTGDNTFQVADLTATFPEFQTRAVGLARTSTGFATIEARLDFGSVASFGRLGFDLIFVNDVNIIIPSQYTITILGSDGVADFTHAILRIDSSGTVSMMQSNFEISALVQPLIVPTSGKVQGVQVHHIDFEIPGDGSLRVFVNGVLRYANTTINFIESGGQCTQGPIAGFVLQASTFSALETFYIDNIQLDTMTQTFFNCPLSCPADLNSDGAVDGADLGLLLGGWGVCPP
jgi:hypothetical protein